MTRKTRRDAWQFEARLRRNAFGWRSPKVLAALREAGAEVGAAFKVDPLAGARAFARLVERIPPALAQVDDSSGAVQGELSQIFDEMAPLFGDAPLDPKERDQLLARIWQAIVDDEMPWIERLADRFAKLVGDALTAARWAERFLSEVKASRAVADRGYCQALSPCLACLYAAGRLDEVLALARQESLYDYRKWGVRALVDLGRLDEALDLASSIYGGERSPAVAVLCEDILLRAGRVEEAYARFGICAAERNTKLATFRALAKRYPTKTPSELLAHLVRSAPGEERKWFAAAKQAGLLDEALDLAERSPCDPRTLLRAAEAHREKRTAFSHRAALASLRWMIAGYGYELTAAEVLAARDLALVTARKLGCEDTTGREIAALAASESGKKRPISKLLGFS